MTTPKAPGVAYWVPVTGPTYLALDLDQWDFLVQLLEVTLSAARAAGEDDTVERLLPMLEQFAGILASLRGEER